MGANVLGSGEEKDVAGSVAFPDPGFVATANRVPVLLWACGNDRSDAWCNEAWTAYTGLSCDDERGEGWATAVHPEDLDRCLDVFRDASARREGFILDYRLRRRDGEYRWMVDNGIPWHSRGGAFLGYAGVCVDVHENRTALEEFRQRERQHAIVADLGHFALEGEDDDELLDRGVKLLADGLGVSLAAAMRLEPDGIGPRDHRRLGVGRRPARLLAGPRGREPGRVLARDRRSRRHLRPPRRPPVRGRAGAPRARGPERDLHGHPHAERALRRPRCVLHGAA